MSETLLQRPNEHNNSFRNTLDNLLETRRELSKTNYYLEQKEKENSFLLSKLKQKESEFDII